MGRCATCKKPTVCVLENTDTGKVLHTFDVCRNCLIEESFTFTPIAEQIILTRDFIMDTIKSKRALNSRIKEVLEGTPDDNLRFPKVISYCEGMGQPEYTITIEMSQHDYFTDEKGQKWVKA